MMWNNCLAIWKKTKLDPYNKSFTQIPKDQRLKVKNETRVDSWYSWQCSTKSLQTLNSQILNDCS